jgi:spore maturation protein CgeB
VSRAELDIVILGLSITSSWGNGHATTYRGLVRALSARGHRVLFLERDVPWYAENRDLPRPPYARTSLYASLDELERFRAAVAEADLVIVGSFVPDGRVVASWALRHARGLTAFYDIDTPATLAAVSADRCAYLDRTLVPRFDLYLSFTGGPTLARLEREFGARSARPFHCSFDPDVYYPEACEPRWDLGYMGTFSADRQPALEQLLLEPARRLPASRFVVAGPLYPDEVDWPANVERIAHLAPAEHRSFYCRQRFTLNLTRSDMVAAGYSPSVRLFEAAACGVPIISDPWPGLETLFLPGREVLLARTARESLRAVKNLSVAEAQRIGARARRRVLAQHTAEHRAAELERHVAEVRRSRAPRLQYA